MNLIDSALDEQFAREKAQSNIFPKLQKELKNICMECIFWTKEIKNDRVHKKIAQTKNA